MPRRRVFRRVHLADVSILLDEGWIPAEREDGTAGFTLYDNGRHAVVLVEQRDDFSDAIMASMELRDG